jgi:hypothetical protein
MTLIFSCQSEGEFVRPVVKRENTRKECRKFLWIYQFWHIYLIVGVKENLYGQWLKWRKNVGNSCEFYVFWNRFLIVGMKENLYGQWLNYEKKCTKYLWMVLWYSKCSNVIVCRWLVTGWWFSPGTPVSSTKKTDCHDISEILLKVALNIINTPLRM